MRSGLWNGLPATSRSGRSDARPGLATDLHTAIDGCVLQLPIDAVLTRTTVDIHVAFFIVAAKDPGELLPPGNSSPNCLIFPQYYPST